MARACHLLLQLAAVLALVACAEAENPQPQAQFPDEGLQATGQIAGKRIAISAGNPIVTFGDCDPEDGRDEDLCLSARTIDGEQLRIVIENPAVLSASEQDPVPVRPDACAGAGCDDVTGHGVVDVSLGGDEARVLSGTLTPSIVRPGHVATDFRFTLASGGRLVGSFNVTR